MHPSVQLVLVLVSACAAGVHGAVTPAARFWEEALHGAPMPEAISDLVQKGIDHSPLVEHYAVPNTLAGTNGNYAYARPSFVDESSAALPGYFFKSQVRVGSTMTVFFPAAAVPPILPRQVAEKVPLSNLADVLSTFHISPSSDEAVTVGKSLRECQAQPAAGELRSCTSSLEATVQSATRMLGGAHGFWAAASDVTSAGLPRREMVVEAVTPLDGDRHVGCHDMPFPYALYMCHMTGRPTKAYKMTLRGLHDGDAKTVVTMAAICHLDTSNWSPSHLAMKMLRTKPGGAPVCHFLSYADMLFGSRA